MVQGRKLSQYLAGPRPAVKQTRRLRELLAQPGIVVAPGAYDPISARLVERCGFPAVYMSGAASAFALPGLPDYGVRTHTEMVQSAGNIANAIDIPLIADGDTGFGGVLNAMRLVRDYERMGVAGVHLEDQELPKRCGHLQGKKLVPLEEHAARIRAAADARLDPDFIIIARVDALTVTGLEDAVRRGKAYYEAGADLVFFDGIDNLEHLEQLPRIMEGIPLLVNMLDGGSTPILPVKELEQLGYKLVIWPFVTLGAAAKAMEEALKELSRTGTTAGFAAKMVGKEELFRLFDFDEVEDLLKKYDLDSSRPN